MRNYIFLGFFVILLSCKNEGNKLPLVKELNALPLWQSEKLCTNKGSIPHDMNILPTHNNIVMVGYTDTISNKYIGLNTTTGIREWTSKYNIKKRFFYPKGFTFQKEKSYFHYEQENKNTTTLFQYDLLTGKLKLRKKHSEIFDGKPTVIKNKGKFVVSLEPEWLNPQTKLKECRFWINTIDDFDAREVFLPPRTNNHSIKEYGTYVSDYVLVQNRKKEILLIYVLNESSYDTTTNDFKEYIFNINCYNLSKKQWVYKNKPCNPISIISENNPKHLLITCMGGRPSNGKGIGIKAYDWRTGEEVWNLDALDFDADPNLYFSPENMAYDNGTIIFSSIKYAYGIDTKTGTIKWKEKGIGTTNSPFVFHKGIAYSVAGHLYGIDVETGKHLLKTKCPSSQFGSDDFWSSIGLHTNKKGKGILIVRNTHYAYGYSTIQ